MRNFSAKSRARFRLSSIIALPLLALLINGCGSKVDSELAARLAYVGLDKAIEKSLNLGFAGFNAANSANIPEQTASGDTEGTLTVTGQVDQSSSTNKGMRLRLGMVNYSDGEANLPDEDASADITFNTSADTNAQPELTLSLRDIPNGTLSGTVVGAFDMSGDLTGSVTLNLSMSGQIEDDGTGKVRRKAGTTFITGTATASDNVYSVNVNL